MTSLWSKRVLAATLAALATVAPAAAQQPLPLKPGKAWKHKHSGISVPATLAGAPRQQGVAYAPDDLDVGVAFAVGDAAESLTFYIFRNTNGAVPVWFAQAQWGIEHRGAFGQPKLTAAPQAFVPPGQTSASGLKAIYEPSSGNYRSTGVMLLPVGQWYVKVRASSQTRSPAELGAWMEAALAGIGWPGKIAAAPGASPVADCPSPLAFPVEARDAPKNGNADLMSGLLGMAASQGRAKSRPEDAAALAAVRWCRDTGLDGNATVYRQNADPENYLLAMGDNGNGIWVGPDPGTKLLAMTEKDKPPPPMRYSITLMTAVQNVNFVAQDRLPSPQRVVAVVDANRRTTTVPTWGKNKTIAVTKDSL